MIEEIESFRTELVEPVMYVEVALDAEVHVPVARTTQLAVPNGSWPK